ncbi:MAG: RecX family transcriptional regulator [Proteobacteria bacterium]|nr:RecX family transcriptional regulator [Pseudomonadota bacterium]
MRKKDAKPRKATPRHLENSALYYLQRFATSSENLKRVLMRKVARSAYVHDTDVAESEAFVQDLIARFQRSGLLDDAVFAKGRAETLHRRGNSGRQIRAKLRQKGVADDDIDTALAALGDGGEAELAAALNYAKRRRFGPFAAKRPTPEQREKQLASLARAGFSYDVARRVLEGLSA